MEEHLSIKEIYDRLQEIPGWEMDGHTSIYKEFEFKDFKEAMEFVNNVAQEAQRENHHPDILIKYKKVRLTLSTHDENALTYKDFKMAKIIGQLV